VTDDIRDQASLSCGMVSYLRDGQGPPTFLLHTIGGSAKEYERLIPRLRDALDVIAVDLPGHGSSVPLDEFDPVPDIAGLLVELADALGIDRFNVVGNSLSGTNAIEAAIKWPGRVRKVALISGTGPWARQPGLPERRNLPTHSSENKEIGWFRDQFHDPVTADAPGFFEWWVSTRSAADDEMIRAWRRRPLLDRNLAECTAPLLLVTGERDPQHPLAWAEAWAALLPDARVAQIPSVRHFLNLEAPDALARILREFLA
jgi:3-oxoadipate enol-lactonase/4-carboxymuconolactone decarboxylase